MLLLAIEFLTNFYTFNNFISMIGMTTRTSTDTNQLNITIPDELKGVELRVIILPSTKDTNQEIEFFSETELQQLALLQLIPEIADEEDYSKW